MKLEFHVGGNKQQLTVWEQANVWVSSSFCNKLPRSWWLEPDNFLTYYLTVPEVRGPTRSGRQQGCVLPGGSRGSSFPRPPALLSSRSPPSLMPALRPSLPSSHLLLGLSLLCLSFMFYYDYSGPTQITQDNVPVSKSLTSFYAQSLFCCERGHSRGPGVRMWVSLRSPYFACHTQLQPIEQS